MPSDPDHQDPAHPGMSIDRNMATDILTGLRTANLPKAQWTHGAHLVAATMLLDEMGLDEALDAMPDMIRRFNLQTGGINSDTEGYHHTLTIFYLRIISAFCSSHREQPAHERATTLLASPLAARSYPLRFYSHDLLFSVKARRDWVEPDLAALPAFSENSSALSEAPVA